jgi:hypothetical protein
MGADQICRENDIEHRLTKPNHPWTNTWLLATKRQQNIFLQAIPSPSVPGKKAAEN